MENQAGIAAAAEQNKGPILEILQQVLAEKGVGATRGISRPLVLELASGTGQHAVHFCRDLTHLDWQPSDPDPAALRSIALHRAASDCANLREPLHLDVMASTWPIRSADALFCANMIHIAPWSAAIGLADGAARILPPGAPAILYGPFRREGAHISESNAAFDESLRRRDQRWGVRDLEAVAALFAERGFGAPQVFQMPANNLILVFRREGST